MKIKLVNLLYIVLSIIALPITTFLMIWEVGKSNAEDLYEALANVSDDSKVADENVSIQLQPDRDA